MNRNEERLRFLTQAYPYAPKELKQTIKEEIHTLLKETQTEGYTK